MKYRAMAALAVCLLLFGTACNAGNPPVPAAGTVNTTEAVDSTTETTSQTQESATETESAATTGSAVTTSRPNVTAPPTKTPVTTSQVHTTAGTTGTRPFHELYADNCVVAAIKEKYIDYNREYTAGDFPELDNIVRVETINIGGHFPTDIDGQIIMVYLTEHGERALREAMECLKKNHLLESVYLSALDYTD